MKKFIIFFFLLSICSVKAQVIINNGISPEIYISGDTVYLEGVLSIHMSHVNYEIKSYDPFTDIVFMEWSYRDSEQFYQELSVFKHIHSGQWYYTYHDYTSGLILYRGNSTLASDFRHPSSNNSSNVRSSKK